MKNIEAKKLRPEMNIIDIRNYSDYELGHIFNAKNIPMNELLINRDKYLNKNETYFIYCSFGNKSRKTCELLDNLGYDVINVLGGYDSFK